MATLDIRSKAPTPSTESTVASWSTSVNVWMTWAMHSAPALVVSAYWNGAVRLICCAIVLATNRQKTSPDNPSNASRRFAQR